MSGLWFRASVCALLVGCGGGAGAGGVGLSARSPAQTKVDPGAAASALLPSHALVALDDDGAFAAFARTADGRGVLVFAQGGAWRAQPVDRAGAPVGEPITLAKMAGQPTQLALHATPDGFVAAWDVALDENHGISVVALDADGRPRGTPTAVAQVADRVSFIDVVVSDAGAFLLHEIRNRGPRGQGSRVVLTPIDPRRGKARGTAVVVVDDAPGWQIAATHRGAVVARVVSAPPAAGTAPRDDRGRVEVVAIDDAGTLGATIAVSPGPTARIDVEIAALGDRVLVAWTDATDAEGAAVVASVDLAKGKATAPARVSPPAEDAALVGLWAASRGGGGRALLAWEGLAPRAPEVPRRFVLSTVDAAGTVSGARAALPFVGDGRPDVVPDGDGFAALILAPVSQGSEAPAPGAPVWPSFVRIGPDLSARASEPLRAAPFEATDGVPDLAFGLSCAAGGCLAIGGSAGAPAPLSTIALPIRESAYRSVLETTSGAAAASPGRAAEVTTLGSGERIADVAAVRLAGGAELAGWVTWFADGVTEAPSPPRGEKPYAATLAVRPLGATAGDPIVVSQRAASAGGVAMTAMPSKKGGEVVIGWVASDDGIPQVFATKLDAAGKKLAQKKVTVIARGKKGAPSSECSSVDVGFAPQASDGRPGIVIAWIDTRDGDGEVYAARLNTNLEKVGADRRLTRAAGNASEVQLLVRGAETFLTWIEAREGADNGDVYVTRLNTANLDEVGETTRVFASAGPTHGVRFVEADAGRVFLTWIDDAARDPKTGAVADGSASAGLRMVELDSSAKPTGAPRRIAGAGASVIEGAIGCLGGACRGLVAVPGGPPRLLGVEVDGSAAGGGAQEVGSALGPHVPMAPVGGDGSLFVVGDDDGRGGRVRALRLAW